MSIKKVGVGLVDCIFFLFFLQQNIQATKNYGFSPTFDSIIQLQVHIKRKEENKSQAFDDSTSPSAGPGGGLGETGEGEVASCVWVTRMRFFGGENHPIPQNLCIYMQVLDAGNVYIWYPSLQTMLKDGPLSADCSVVISQNNFIHPIGQLWGGKGE